MKQMGINLWFEHLFREVIADRKDSNCKAIVAEIEG